jgi:hypothetical protein
MSSFQCSQAFEIIARPALDSFEAALDRTKMAIYSRFADWGLPCPITGQPSSIYSDRTESGASPSSMSWIHMIIVLICPLLFCNHRTKLHKWNRMINASFNCAWSGGERFPGQAEATTWSSTVITRKTLEICFWLKRKKRSQIIREDFLSC